MQKHGKTAVVEKRFGLLVGDRPSDTSERQEAAAIQDMLRHKSGAWNGAREIRKWRESR